ncbi:carbohydrate kinase family protein [Terrabacter sp. MAHUQ-38]|uniref:carbohydrate kinase family protein n=1 Tax=unclassified Terrabacter TaxID=2630222 RepID=UPI00165E02C9|nr:PfkB family carbohydrate kinase [Terrabacter sp. MAHUQ-38]MBC9822815.1 carbohydrate kinase family protein [Terrabacter sp. MAHUQ-38]
MSRIVVAGHLCVDLTPRLAGPEHIDPGHLFEVGPLSVRLGGCVGNTGGDLAGLGLPVDVVAAVGDDDLGELLRRTVSRRTGMTPVLRSVPGSRTSYSLVFETPSTDRTFWHHVGSNALFDGTELRDTNDPDLVHVGYPSLLPALVAEGGARLREMLRQLRARGATTSLDLAVIDRGSPTGSLDWQEVLRGSMDQVDVVTPSVDDLVSALPEQAGPGVPDDAGVERLAEMLLDWGAAVAAVTAGPRGVFLRGAGRARLRAAGRGFSNAYSWADARQWVRPYVLERVATTTGAGDAATAGMLYGILAGMSPGRTGSLAMACSAAVVSGRRPTPAVIASIDRDLAGLPARLTGHEKDPR